MLDDFNKVAVCNFQPGSLAGSSGNLYTRLIRCSLEETGFEERNLKQCC